MMSFIINLFKTVLEPSVVVFSKDFLSLFPYQTLSVTDEILSVFEIPVSSVLYD